MTDATKGLLALIVSLALGIAVGLGTGWKLWKPRPATPETYAAAQRQQDQSLVLERVPQPDAKPAHELPKGAKLERVVQVTVQPHQPAADPVSPVLSGPGVSVGDNLSPTQPDCPPCPPVRVDLSLVRMPDLSRRIIASSPDGEVIAGVDIPVEAPRVQKQLKWAAGPSWNPADRTFGAWLERDVTFVRVGVDLHQVREPIAAGGRVTWAGMIRAGFRF